MDSKIVFNGKWHEDLCPVNHAENGTKCHELCEGKIALRNMYSYSNIPPRFILGGNIDFKLTSAQDKPAFKYLEVWRRNAFENVKNKESLFIHSSGKGNGKTSWACDIAHTFMVQVFERGLSPTRPRVVYVSVSKLMEMMRQAMDDPDVNKEKQQFLKNIYRANLIILDDLGAERSSEYVIEQLYILINDLYNKEKSIIVTSNFNIQQIEERLGGRIADRIRGMCIDVELKGGSKRGVRK